MRDMIEEAINDNGQTFSIVRSDGTVNEEAGYRVVKESYVWFLPETELQIGDQIVDPSTGANYHIVDLERVKDEGQPVGVMAHYETGAQREDAPVSPQSSTLGIQGNEQRQEASEGRPQFGSGDIIASRQELRKEFLSAIYSLAAGNPSQWVYWRDVAPMLGWDEGNDSHFDDALDECCEDFRPTTP